MGKKKGQRNENSEDGNVKEESQDVAADDTDAGTAEQNEEKVEDEDDKIPEFPIVGIGASAGGLEAFEQFFTNMPSGDAAAEMAFVLVQHLDPDHKSILVDLVKRYTKMKVFEVKDGMEIQPNCAYIIPPNRDMAILHNKLHLMEPVAPRGLRLPIDSFFRSLAQDRGHQAICVILSGTGTDGTLGLRAIKGEGGMAMVQSPESAGYDGMPRSAIATGLVDYILSPDEMPEQLIMYVQHAFERVVKKKTEPVAETTDWLQKVFILLRDRTGHDFTYYKQNTILRRIERRMTVHQVGNTADYVRYLQQNPMEVEILFRELLIGVTNFFRDPQAFDALKEKVIPGLFEDRSAHNPLRIWVPGCSTGEEAYSIAMLAQEHIEELERDFEVQIFATDIDSDAIETARAGVYPGSIAVDVSPERLQHFFTKEGDTYRIKRPIRDMLVFSTQNVIKDPPFSRIDLLSCRNLLIYMGEQLQKKLLPLFHYSLNQDGYLFLGTSESISGFGNLFGVIDRKWKLFQRKGEVASHRPPIEFPGPVVALDEHKRQMDGTVERDAKPGFRGLAEKVLLSDYAPACVIIDEKCEILYVHGRTGKYLEQAPGTASLNILGMAREGLKLEMTTAIRRAITRKEDVRREGLRVKINGGVQNVDLTVKVITDTLYPQGTMMVVFEDREPQILKEPAEAASEQAEEKSQRVVELERELGATKQYLQTTIEELETSNEELKSTNEELQSSNEELQSTNQELETSKEELQSVNEELSTVNSELENKVDLLSKANNDMSNLLTNTEIATIFLDNNLLIKRFTPAATKVTNLIQTDVGRPLAHIVPNLAYDSLVRDTREVLDTLIPKEMEIQSSDGSWYFARVLPYRTTENVIEGAVLTFVEITEQKQVQEELERQHYLIENGNKCINAILDAVRESLLVLDSDLRVVSANRSFYRDFQVTKEETEGCLLYELGDGQWNISRLRELLEKILPENTTFDDFEVEHEFPNIGQRKMLLNARQIESERGERDLVLLAIEDVTER